jgi:hypothetical protein
MGPTCIIQTGPGDLASVGTGKWGRDQVNKVTSVARR